MRTRTKTLIVILLAASYFAFVQHFGAHSVSKSDLPRNLDRWNNDYNSEYFNGKLPSNILIDWSEHDNRYMATTTVLPSGRFRIALNQKYCLADRTAHLTLLHEDCHVLTFSEISESKKSEHGPRWRTCMLNLHQQGAFKNELIDGDR